MEAAVRSMAAPATPRPHLTRHQQSAERHLRRRCNSRVVTAASTPRPRPPGRSPTNTRTASAPTSPPRLAAPQALNPLLAPQSRGGAPSSPYRGGLAAPPNPRAPLASSAAAAAAAAGGPAQLLPYSQEITRALRATREQTVRQGFMFAGPDQLLLGILAAADAAHGRGGGGGAAARLVESALGGGDADSVREWLNEQTGVVAPLVYGGGGGAGGAVSSSRLRPSDVEFTAAAMDVMRRAQSGAEAMGSRSVGTHHLLLVLLGEEGGSPTTPGIDELQTQQQQTETPREGGREDGASASAEAEAGAEAAEAQEAGPTDSMGGGGEREGELRDVSGSLPALLRAVGADTAALREQLMALAEGDVEAPAGLAAAAYRDVVSHLRDTYRRQAGLPYNERDDAAFRAAAAPGRARAGRAAVQVAGAGEEEEEDDPYE